MNSIGSAIFAFVRIPGAHIADKYGRRRIISTFTYGMAITYLFYVFASDWRFILLAMVVFNLSQIYHPALEAIEADSMPPERRGMGYAAINVLPIIPAIFAAPISGLLVERLGLVPSMRIAYGVVFLVTLMVAIIRTLFLKETLESSESLNLRELRPAFRESLGSIAEAWSLMSRDVVFLTAVLLISAFETPAFHIYMALYANDVVGVSGLQWSLMDTVWTTTTLLVGMPLGKMIDTIGRKRSILIGYLFSTPIIALFIVSRGFLQLMAVNILFAMGQAVMFPAFSALKADLIPQDKRGRVMGIIGTLTTFAMVPSAAIFGLLYQFAPAAPFILAIFLEVITVLILVSQVKEPRQREI